MGAHSNSHEQDRYQIGFFLPLMLPQQHKVNAAFPLVFPPQESNVSEQQSPVLRATVSPVLKLVFAAKNKTIFSIVQRAHDINPVTCWAPFAICKNKSGVCLQIVAIFPGTLHCKTTVCLECVLIFQNSFILKAIL